MMTLKMAGELTKHQDEWMENVLRTKVVPPILGEITSEAIVERGVTYCGRYDRDKSECWVEQHGERISGIRTIEQSQKD